MNLVHFAEHWNDFMHAAMALSHGTVLKCVTACVCLRWQFYQAQRNSILLHPHGGHVVRGTMSDHAKHSRNARLQAMSFALLVL